MSGEDELAREMAAALGHTYPRVRIGQLEPVMLVARGIIALGNHRVAEQATAAAAVGEVLTYLQRDEIYVHVLAECLATWQQATMETAIDKWLAANPNGRVEFDTYGCRVVGALPPGRLSGFASPPICTGEGPTSAEALAAALESWDQRGDEDES